MGFTLNLKPYTLYLSIALFSLLTLSSKAQIYPVQVTPVLVAPYTLNTSDYYSGTAEKLAVVLTNTDLQKPTLNVRLRMYIEGQNAKLQSRDGAYYPTITLDAGIPQRISLSDLAPYFNIDNLNLQGITRAQYTQNGKLPEGFYQFCFEAIEVNTGQVLSRKSCSMAWISLSDPPLLNLPIKGESIASREVQNVVFQWTPRNMGSPNGAFNTEYEFTLKELWDTGIAPEAAFESSQPLYQTTVKQTTLLMGPAEPQLVPGKRYAWRVRAVSTSPTGEQADAYRNNGFSEIYWFTYQDNCKPPFGINASISSGRATINWAVDEANGGIPAGGYTLQYRERSQSTGQWYSLNTMEPKAMLYDLKPGLTYEYRIGSSCNSFPVGGGWEGATYSDILTLEINGNPNDKSTVNCGMISPEITIANKTPIQSLNPGELFTAGKFPIKVTTVSGGSGNFSGEGYVTIPMIGQVSVKVRFSNIGVNTDRQLYSGVVETSYDKDEKQIADAGAVVDMVKDIIDLIGGGIDKLKELLKDPIKNKDQIAVAEKEFSDAYTEMVNKLPISEEEKKTKIAALEELTKQTYLASNSENLDEATVQAAEASKKLDELKESVKTDLANAETICNTKLEQIVELINSKKIPLNYLQLLACETIATKSSTNAAKNKTYNIARYTEAGEFEISYYKNYWEGAYEHLFYIDIKNEAIKKQGITGFWLYFDPVKMYVDNKRPVIIALRDDVPENPNDPYCRKKLDDVPNGTSAQAAFADKVQETVFFGATIGTSIEGLAAKKTTQCLDGMLIDVALQMGITAIVKTHLGEKVTFSGLVSEISVPSAVASCGAAALVEKCTTGCAGLAGFATGVGNDIIKQINSGKKVSEIEVDQVLYRGLIQAVIAMATQKIISFGVRAWSNKYTPKQIDDAIADAGKNPEKYLSNGLGIQAVDRVVLDATKLGMDDATLSAARWIKPETGWYDVVLHGTPDNFMVFVGENWVSISHRDLLKYLISKGYSGKVPIRLISCNTGVFPDAVGKNLANKLGLEVKAPKGLITVFKDGTYEISNNGGWMIFKPGL